MGTRGGNPGFKSIEARGYCAFATQVGNVGIGTTSPDELLHLYKASGNTGLEIEAVSGGDPIIRFVSDNNRTGDIFYTDATTLAKFSYDHSAQAFKTYAHNNTTVDFYLSETEAYFPSQDVGIGTTVTAGGFNVNNTGSGGYYNMSNQDSGNYKFTNPGGRLLTSNESNWVYDGRDPVLTLASAGNSNATTIGYSIGLNLYSNTATDNTFSPLIAFSNLSNSGSYATAYGCIMGKKNRSRHR